MADKEPIKYYKIYGYDSNLDLSGSHICPLLCIVRAKDESQALEYANALPGYKSSCYGEGYIVEIDVVDLIGGIYE